MLKQQLPEAVAALDRRTRNLVGTKTWRDLKGAAHNRAFVVAGAMQADLLADLSAAVRASLDNGLGIEDFRKRFQEVVDKHGWSYKGEFNWRTRVIYQQNLLTSQAAGRLAQLRDPELRLLKPFWMYRHSGSENPRHQHKAWDGLTLVADHPWFRSHYPPNGWGCGCRVVAVSRRDVARMGGRIVDEPPPDEPGAIDEGWDYMPGGDVTDELNAIVEGKAKQLPLPLAKVFVEAAKPRTIDDYISDGKARAAALGDPEADPQGFYDALSKALQSEVGTGAKAVVEGRSPVGKQLAAASALFPASWVEATNKLGRLYVKQSKARCWALTITEPRKVKIPSFGVREVKAGDGFITLRAGDVGVTVHEYAHRIQAALPALDKLFQDLHLRRTQGDALVVVTPGHLGETGRPDGYYHPYQGREYAQGGALEMMTMALQAVLLGPAARPVDQLALRRLAQRDPEMLHFTLGILFGWKP